MIASAFIIGLLYMAAWSAYLVEMGERLRRHEATLADVKRA